VFDGDGFGVGLTVAQLGAVPPPEPGRRPSRLTEVLPPSARSRAGVALELGRMVELEARIAAYKASLVVDLADRHDPGDLDGEEFFVDELAMTLGSSISSAGSTWTSAQTLVRLLPGTWAALADGEIDQPRGRAIAAEVAAHPGTEPVVLLAVEAAVLPIAAELTVGGLRAAVRRELIAHDPAAAERRRRQAADRADATVRPDPEAPGRADLVVGMSTEDAHACWATADATARAAQAAGDPRPLGVLRAEAVRDRILRRDDQQPPVAAQVTVLAPLDALQRVHPTGERAPVGEVGGQPITATHLRTLLESVDALCPGGLQQPTGGSLRYALTDPDGALRAVLTHSALVRLAGRGCPDHPPGTDCGCGLVDGPPDVDRYRPSDPQYEFIRTRDRRCRMPGCTTRAAWADLDHVIPHACGGATSCDNMCCLCRRHHRLKTFAPGWTTRLDPDGTYTVTTPTGITRTSRPPGMYAAATARASRAGPAPPGPPPEDEPPEDEPPEDDPPPF
jgi:hypothetical protein